ncbi:protein of unknown function [Oscillibacter sp. PC13]|uniref:DUF4062 domain-containing protein n=1 Tax=Oscillibacter sp. PC13 TaxID=1855299 RepID=UPI0008F1A81D|nr:DUF4062 domain-containing protein [Oscillibacter sp. PC13]SFO93975.1 protein of unknown function [Oscillibacter sp. PC13]
MEKKYQVFVSSTYDDLKEERLAAINILLDNGCISVGMEQFPASGLGIMEYIEKSLIDCDYYILILAGRYGSLDSDGIGFTEKEFICAQEHSIPILVFCHNNIDLLPVSKCEGTDAGRQKLREFRNRALKNTMAKMYSSVDDLKTKIATSINRAKTDIPREGWIRASWATTHRTESNTLQSPDVYQFEPPGTFVSVRMQHTEQPLFLEDDSNFKIAISSGENYEIKALTSEGKTTSIGLIPDIPFFPSQLIPGQYSLHHSKLNINSNGGIIWRDKNRCGHFYGYLGILTCSGEMNSPCTEALPRQNARTAQKHRPTVWGPGSGWHLYCLDKAARKFLVSNESPPAARLLSRAGTFFAFATNPLRRALLRVGTGDAKDGI